MDENSAVEGHSMQEERMFFEQPTSVASHPNRKSRVWILIVLLIIILAAVSGWFIFRGRKESASVSEVTPIPAIQTPEPTQSPTPTPIDKSQISIEILNGTGITGEAGVLKGRLTPLGYSTIKTGNATKQDNSITQVSFASGVPESVQKEIKDVLTALYQQVQTGSALSQNGIDVRIVTGLRKGATPKPSPSASPKASSSPTASPSATPR